MFGRPGEPRNSQPHPTFYCLLGWVGCVGHCPLHTKRAPQSCPVAKPDSSFATQLGRVHPARGTPPARGHGPTTLTRRICPRLSSASLSPRHVSSVPPVLVSYAPPPSALQRSRSSTGRAASPCFVCRAWNTRGAAS
jgi:hypothetical protein